MKLNKTTIIALIAASGLLALSPALRAQDTNKDAKPAQADGKTKKGGRSGLTLEMLKTELKLTDAQVAKVKPVWEERTTKIQALSRADRATGMQAINEETNKKMKEILPADLYKQYEQLLAKSSARGGKKKAAPADAP